MQHDKEDARDKHKNEPEERAEKRKHLGGKKKIAVVMKEYKKGTLHSGKSKKPVSNPSQAVAIALSEARKKGAKIPKK